MESAGSRWRGKAAWALGAAAGLALLGGGTAMATTAFGHDGGGAARHGATAAAPHSHTTAPRADSAATPVPASARPVPASSSGGRGVATPAPAPPGRAGTATPVPVPAVEGNSPVPSPVPSRLRV
jgi:hypothetical protein